MAKEDNIIHIDWSEFNKGMTNLKAVLEKLDEGVVKKLSKETCKEATQPMFESVVNNCPQDTGSLRASMQLRVFSSKVKGFTSAGIWPDRNYEFLDSRGVTRKPVHYLHLVEFGTIKTAPTMFLQKSFARTWRWSLAIITRKFDDVIASLPEAPQ